MGNLREWFDARRSDRDLRRTEKRNLKEALRMRDDRLGDDAWLFGLVWGEKRDKYKRSKTAFFEGLKKAERDYEKEEERDENSN